MSLPAANYMNQNTRTEGEMKQAFEDLLAGAKQIPGAGQAKQSLTIASGSVTPAAGAAQILELDTEGLAATDDLTNIVTTNLGVNSLVMVKIANNARVIVIKNSAGGTGQMILRTAGDFTLSQTSDFLLFWVNGTQLEEIDRFPVELTPAILTKTSGYTVVTADRNKTIDCTSGTFTLTLPAAATAGKGFVLFVRNSGTGVITLDGNASETVDGVTTMNMYMKESFLIVCDGTGWKTVGRKTGLIPIASQVASGSTTIDFTVGIGSDFDNYQVNIVDMQPATDNQALWLRVTQDGGSTYKAGATDYKYAAGLNTDAGVSSFAGSTGDTKFAMVGTLSNLAARTYNGIVRFFNPTGTANNKMFHEDSCFIDAVGALSNHFNTGGFVLNTSAINGIRFLMSSGNITAGTFTLYGVRK